MPLMAMPAMGAPAEGTPAVGIRDFKASANRAASFARCKLRCTAIFSHPLACISCKPCPQALFLAYRKAARPGFLHFGAHTTVSPCTGKRPVRFLPSLPAPLRRYFLAHRQLPAHPVFFTFRGEHDARPKISSKARERRLCALLDRHVLLPQQRFQAGEQAIVYRDV